MELAVEVTNLTKTYKLYSSPLDRALDALRKEETAARFTALDDVSAEFPKGEVIAILGKNGSGKSTLLKIITGVTTPTDGAVNVNGRVSAMLELTSGFDQELTGTENIYLRALAMGIPKDEIAEKEAEIIEFADIGDHIDQPVRTYSSGMKARLGFAVSASVDPDILIIDEVLAVGDEVFRLKCIERMEEFRKQGKTILFVSHALFTVKAFCTKGLWLNEGKVMAAGEIGEVIPEYENFLRQERARQKESDRAANSHSDKPLGKSDLIETKNFRMLDEDGGKTTEFKFGEDILFEFEYLVKQPMDRLTFCYTVRNAEHLEVYMADKQNEANVISSSTGLHSMRVRLKEPRLLPGDYLLSGEIWNNDAGLFVGYANKRPFKITQTKYLGTGIVHIDYEFGNDE